MTKVAADTGSLRVKHFNKLLPCLNVKARKYYKFTTRWRLLHGPSSRWYHALTGR